MILIIESWSSEGDKGFATFTLDGKEVKIEGEKEAVQETLETMKAVHNYIPS